MQNNQNHDIINLYLMIKNIKKLKPKGDVRIMAKVDFYNEKGNVAVSVRNQMKEQTLSKLVEVLEDQFDSVEVNSDKEISVQIAEDENRGTPIYARMSFSVTDKDPQTVAKRKAKSKEPKDEPTVNLFE